MAGDIAVLILTLNEEENIEACIDSVKFADEIIVVDAGSTDKTVELAQAAGAKVIVRSMEQGFAEQRNFAHSLAHTEWVLFLDADERISEALAQEIRGVISKASKLAYKIVRHNFVLNNPVYHGGHAPDWVLRLFPRGQVCWEGIVHESPQTKLAAVCLQAPAYHFTYRSWEQYFAKFNRYTTMMAEKMNDKGKRACFADVFFRPIIGFFKFYILKSGWRDGKMGFILAAFHVFYTMAKYVKLWTLQQNRG